MADQSASLPCPACSGRLYPRLLECTECGLHVQTDYRTNEFSDLDEDSLHLLRIFVACEGRIRDMEAALGVSYPTVKSRLSALKARIGSTVATHTSEIANQQNEAPIDVLGQLERGEIDYTEALRRIKKKS